MGIVKVGGAGPPPPPNMRKLIANIAEASLGHILDRVSKSTDIHGKPFAPYSKKYSEVRLRDGRSLSVRLNLSGGMMNGLHVMSIDGGNVKAKAIIGLMAAYSPHVDMRKDKSTTPKYKPLEQNVIGYYLHFGTKDIPARPWLGGTKDFHKKMAAYIARKLNE